MNAIRSLQSRQNKNKMHQLPENTKIKSKYFILNKEQPYASNFQIGTVSKNQKESFTPAFKERTQTQDAKPMRKTGKLQKFAIIYDQYFKNASTTSKFTNQSNYKNPQNISNDSNVAQKTQSNYVFETPQKYQQFFGIEQAESTANQNQQATSKEFLFINSPLQSYHTPLDFDNPQLLFPNNSEILKYHLDRAKKQGQKLKDQNLKLRLEKVKIAAKTSKNQTMKLIPLKIQHQRLKKQIEKLIQEKQILEISKKMKEANRPDEININGMQFKVIKHIPGTIYSQQEADYQKQDSFEYSRVLTKPSNLSFTQNSPSPSKYSNSSMLSDQNISIANRSSQNLQTPNFKQSSTYFSSDLAGNKPLTGTSFIHAEMQKIKQKQSNLHEQTSKSAFLTFAKASLKNGNSRPTFCKANSSEFVQGSNPSAQGNSQLNKSLFSNGSGLITGNYQTNNSSSLMVRPVTSTSHSPRTQNF